MTSLTDGQAAILERRSIFSDERRRATTLALRAARIPMLAESYLTLSAVSAAVAALAISTAAGLSLLRMSGVAPLLRVALLLGVAVGSFVAIQLCFALYPRTVASGRARAIDAEFPSVAMLCYALARGGMNATDIFRAVAKERGTYGEISREFALVIRDIEQLGQDLNSALQSVAATTPSGTLKVFFGGLVTILNSGADPRDYFHRQASMQLAQAELRMEKEVEQAGMLAETYVSGLLVLPLLLVVILSVLSVLGDGGTAFIPIIIFVMVPGGTFVYLVLVDMLLPPDELSVARGARSRARDFGVDTTPEDVQPAPLPTFVSLAALKAELDRTIARDGEGADLARRQRRVVWLVWAHQRVGAALRSFHERAVAEPLRAFVLSAPAAALVLAAAGGALYLQSIGEIHVLSRGMPIVYGATTLAIVVLVVALLPVSVYHEIHVRRARAIDAALPETLSKLSGFNERGVSLLRSFQILGRSTDGPIGKEFRALDRDVSWTGSLRNALARMRERAATRRMRKLCILFERGTGATGNIKEVLDIAATDAQTTESQGTRKSQAMMSYVVVVYVVFAVFLYVIFSVVTLFYGSAGFAMASTRGVGLSSRGIAPDTAKMLFFFAVLIQGACCGMVAGKLGEGRVLSGLKHAMIMVVLAWVSFYSGVLA